MTTPIFSGRRAPGSRPKGARSETRSFGARQENVSAGLRPRYDFLNHFAFGCRSIAFGGVGRQASSSEFFAAQTTRNSGSVLRHRGSNVRNGARADEGLARPRKRNRIPNGSGSDFAQPMLDRAREKGHRHHRAAVFVRVGRFAPAISRRLLRSGDHGVRFSQSLQIMKTGCVKSHAC